MKPLLKASADWERLSEWGNRKEYIGNFSADINAEFACKCIYYIIYIDHLVSISCLISFPFSARSYILTSSSNPSKLSPQGFRPITISRLASRLIFPAHSTREYSTPSIYAVIAEPSYVMAY